MVSNRGIFQSTCHLSNSIFFNGSRLTLLASAFAIVAWMWFQSRLDGKAGSVFPSTGKPDNGIRNSAVYMWLPGGVWGGVFLFSQSPEEIRSFSPLWGKFSKSIAILRSRLKLMKFRSKEEDRGPVLFPETFSPTEQHTFRVLQQSNRIQATCSISGQWGDGGVTFIGTASGTGLTQRDKLLLKAAACWMNRGSS